MQNEIILNGISFDQLQDSFRTIVQNEVQKIVSGLTTPPRTIPRVNNKKTDSRNFRYFFANPFGLDFNRNHSGATHRHTNQVQPSQRVRIFERH